MNNKEMLKIKKAIKSSSNVFLMGHKNIDLDAFAGCLGMCCYASYFKKDFYIILDDNKLEHGVNKAINYYKEKINIISSRDAKEEIKGNSLLIIVDTNKKSLVQNEKILGFFNKIIVIDHHNLGNDTIDCNNVEIYNYTEKSSVSEIIVHMLSKDKYQVDDKIATILLAGIVLDTNGFSLKTTTDTYYAAYYLTSIGADNSKVQYLLKQDIHDYIERQKVITEVIVTKKIAISKGLQTKIYRREELAKIADTLLLFNNIEASFVVGKTSKGIGISARSIGDVDVGKIMETFGGGGNSNEAASLIIDKSLNETLELIKSTIKKIKR